MRGKTAFGVGATVGFIVLAVIVAVFSRSLVFSPEAAEAKLKAYLQANGRLSTLERFAGRIIAEQSADNTSQSEKQELSAIGVTFVKLFREDGRIVGVGLMFGSADQHYGVLFFEEGRKPSLPQNVKQWTKDSWYFSEIPLRK